jgi:hypothetical protein
MSEKPLFIATVFHPGKDHKWGKGEELSPEEARDELVRLGTVREVEDGWELQLDNDHTITPIFREELLVEAYLIWVADQPVADWMPSKRLTIY